MHLDLGMAGEEGTLKAAAGLLKDRDRCLSSIWQHENFAAKPRKQAKLQEQPSTKNKTTERYFFVCTAGEKARHDQQK